MSYWTLSLTLVFILITMLLSLRQKLGLEKEIAIGTVRAAVQLFAVGYILEYVFRSRQPLIILLILAVMITVAAENARKRGKGLPGAFWRIMAAIAATETATMGLLLLLGMVKPEPQQIIPISGMIIGNAMVVCALYLNQMMREVEASRGEIEVLLSLGATVRQAVQDPLKRAVKASMIPSIDGMKTVGIVQLPGMMTGMIIAGASPLQAVRYQILIMFSFSASAALTSILLALISYGMWFSDDGRLLGTPK
ncbi:ABC transporter permease [Gorillibacterium sp. sgz500922]|uniref:ABC transporter permease n=1 Tax=Gorillibacterium sp. sgz500922 TaxID=3446694 RepID=UPI003F66DB34